MIKTVLGSHLDEKFWTGFATQYWERKSLVVKNIKSSILEFDEAYVFDLLLNYSHRCRKSKSVSGLKLYVDGQRLYDEEVLQNLPVKSDKSLIGYHARMEKIYPDYCLVCDELLQTSADKWGILSAFTDQLYKHVGFPNRFAEMGLYLGNYQKTPFGVHVDSCGVFSFPVVGTKIFRLWEPEFVKRNPSLERAHRYNRFKKNSNRLVVQPGDMAYWPSSAWHIAESSGHFSATWSLGIWVDKSHRENILGLLETLLAADQGPEVDRGTTRFTRVHSIDGHVRALPKDYSQSILAIRHWREQTLRETFLKDWMQRTSKKGFKTGCPLPPQALRKQKLSARDHVVICDLQAPILWTELGQNAKLALAYNGLLIEAPFSTNLLRLIKRLNLGERCAVGDFIKGPHRKGNLEILRRLFAAGAFVQNRLEEF